MSTDSSITTLNPEVANAKVEQMQFLMAVVLGPLLGLMILTTCYMTLRKYMHYLARTRSERERTSEEKEHQQNVDDEESALGEEIDIAGKRRGTMTERMKGTIFIGSHFL
jgi:hypothetical protein